LAQRVITVMKPAADEKHLSMSLAPGPEIPLACVDADRISQVIRNLLSNAIRYTPDGGGIEVGLCRVANAGEKADGLDLYVKDNGCGIDAADLPHVFDRFYRTDRSRSRASGGSGIGLTIVKQITELHGGRVSVESQVGAGTTFHVFLPLAS
jgi:signal transduction histidine kinase